MLVKEAVEVLKKAKAIMIAWGGNAVKIDKDDLLAIDAYGNYMVEEINSEDGVYEICVKMRPVKAGE